MFYYFIISIIALLLIVYYVTNKILFYNFTKDPGGRIAYLNFVLETCYDLVYTKDVVVNIVNETRMNIADAEYRKSLVLFSSEVNLKLGRFKDSIYLRYYFENNEQFLDYLNVFLYTKIQENIVDKMGIESMVDRSNSETTNTEQSKLIKSSINL